MEQVSLWAPEEECSLHPGASWGRDIRASWRRDFRASPLREEHFQKDRRRGKKTTSLHSGFCDRKASPERGGLERRPLWKSKRDTEVAQPGEMHTGYIQVGTGIAVATNGTCWPMRTPQEVSGSRSVEARSWCGR